jgi:hypothetical protein
VTTVHDEVLELAAASIDFDLSATEQETLASHLRECIPCGRRVVGLQGDQRAIAQLPPFTLTPTRVDRVADRVRRGGARPGPTLRVVGLAALLALLALGALAVGSELLRRGDETRLSVVPPGPTDAEPPGPTLRPDAYAADTIVEILVSDLRVRTAPTVDDATSAKLEPLLGRGTRLRIIEGPVTADDYDWYLVQAIGWPHHGWVAAADHDGSPWIEDPSVRASAAPALSADEAALVAGLRDDAAVDCAPKRTKLPARAIAGVECRVNAAVAVRVGAYGFRDAPDATMTYLERMESFGVAPATGDCPGGTVGDAPWMLGDGAAATDADSITIGDSGPWAVGRSGCFLDENGTANARVTCGSTYIGVLGRDADLADLARWVWGSPTGSGDLGEAPGICRSGG